MKVWKKIMLAIDNVKCALQKRNKALKTKNYNSWLAKGYKNKPKVSFIIQSHNKSLQVVHIVSKLRKYENAEIIVIDDGSKLKHTNRLAKNLSNANEFLLRANDLYENVMYDKSIRLANGEFIVLLQDDDDFADLEWVDVAIDHFTKYSQMVILGGCHYHCFNVDHATRSVSGGEYSEPIKSDFAFVHSVDRAPMWIRKSLYMEKLHHFDFNLAPFQYDDCELCLRAWLCNLQVGWYKMEFTSLSAGGMRIWNNSFTSEQYGRNLPQIYNLYAHKKEELDRLVEEARLALTNS